MIPALIHNQRKRWTDCLSGFDETCFTTPGQEFVVGAITGEGIGPEVVGATLKVLEAVAGVSGLKIVLRQGGPIGKDAQRLCGSEMPRSIVDFFRDTFAAKGAILCGPGGGRFVYDIRKAFDLFFKISPLRATNGLTDVARIKPEWLRDVDMLVVRENCGGIYQGSWSEGIHSTTKQTTHAHHQFSYSEAQVRRFLTSAARLSRNRSGKLTVIWKESGVPSISRLWKQCAADVSKAEGISHTLVDIDLMAYLLISDAARFDVVATPNLFGDILADLGAVLLGSRGNSYSGNYAPNGSAVYQTNHGAAYELAGKQVANPAGQIFSAAMMLRESFGCWREAEAIEAAVRSVWQAGVRTLDGAIPGGTIVGTSEMADLVAESAVQLLSREAMALC